MEVNTDRFRYLPLQERCIKPVVWFNVNVKKDLNASKIFPS